MGEDRVSVNPYAERYARAEQLEPGDVFRWFSEIHLVISAPSHNNDVTVHFETFRLDDGSVRDWNPQRLLLLALEGV